MFWKRIDTNSKDENELAPLIPFETAAAVRVDDLRGVWRKKNDYYYIV